MSYTLWSNGRLVGHTELEFQESSPGVRCGWFHPSEDGQQLVEIITSPSRVLLHAAQRNATADLGEMATAGRNVQALELELRAEDGSVVKTEDIGITDTELTHQFADLVADEIDVADDIDDFELLGFAAELDDEEELELFPRYQIIVLLEGYEAFLDAEVAASPEVDLPVSL